ncbi:MAG TPA: 4'-phosphopantetheinyl transferase superfamily protein [Verrucomicrobiae bacterium]|nr:4'-phosphopantetheinyl transferase superfamily protein [Verrucomicrobiae bacterium]
MEPTEILRGIVARFGETEPDKIGAEFSLKTRLLQSSARRAALAAAVRRQLGVNCPAVYSVSTFGELERAVFGAAASVAAPKPAPVPQNGRPSAPAAAPLAASLRCGVDIELIAELPETTDYREHEFYRDTFTPEEIAYCIMQENPRMHFAARWCAKEALHKCDPAFRDEKMSAVEVVRNEHGEVSFSHRTNGTARKLPHALSLSHTHSVAAPFVVLSLNSSPRVAEVNNRVNAVTAQPPAPIVTAPPNKPFPILTALAWLVAFGLALAALIRTL